MAGTAGFEPANAGTKNRCLTTWRRPISSKYNSFFKANSLNCLYDIRCTSPLDKRNSFVATSDSFVGRNTYQKALQSDNDSLKC